jgi:hypothetical protein
VLDCEAERIAVEIGDLSDLYVETPPGVEIGSEGLGQAQVDAIERD